MRCLGCQYDLTKLTENRCPECGRAFDPNDAETFIADPDHGPGNLVLLSITTAAFVVAFVTIILLFLGNMNWSALVESADPFLAAVAVSSMFAGVVTFPFLFMFKPTAKGRRRRRQWSYLVLALLLTGIAIYVSLIT